MQLILTAEDIAELGDVPCLARIVQPDGSKHEVRNAPVLCRGRVRHVGAAGPRWGGRAAAAAGPEESRRRVAQPQMFVPRVSQRPRNVIQNESPISRTSSKRL